MLPPPPCIPGLFGCDEGAIDSGNTGNTGSNSSDGSSTGGSGNGNGSNIDVNLNLDTSGLRNGLNNGLNSVGNAASSLGSGLGNAGSNLAARLGSGVERIARYSINAVNRGTQAVKGYVFSHGPLPSGAIFDPSRSSKNCVQVGQSVQCTLDLNPGESKDFQIAYKVNNSLSCAITRALQTVKNITGSSASGVTTSVNCSMKNESSNSGQSGANGAGSQAGTNTGNFSGSGMYLGSGSGGTLAGVGNNGATMLPLITLEDQGLSRTHRYKTQMPRTGAADIFSTHVHDYVLTHVVAPQTSYFSEGVSIFSFVCIALMVAVIRKHLQAKAL